MKDVSIVIPLYNEEESLPELHQWIQKVMRDHDLAYEVIYVDDGSKDDSWSIVCKLQQEDANVRGIRFSRNYGKSAGLQVGFETAVGEIVVTMDADLQDSPEEIPEMRRMILNEGYDLVSGWKQKRFDPITKTIPTKVYNWATRIMSGIYLHDFNCGLKAYRITVVKSIEIYGEMHRYIPVMAKRAGFSRIGEKVVQHQSRKYGVSKFGMERFLNGFLDLLTIMFITKFSKKPMHLFGSIGVLMFILGSLLFGWIGGEKLYYLYIDKPSTNIAEKSGFFIALTSMLIGTQLFLAGFLGELVSRNSPNRNNYQVSEKV